MWKTYTEIYLRHQVQYDLHYAKFQKAYSHKIYYFVHLLYQGLQKLEESYRIYGKSIFYAIE
jgi:hypothetical protein